MQSYTCPTCGEKLERDLNRLYEHTDQHIVDAIKKQHPEWVGENGFCKKCMSHFKDAINQTHQGVRPATVNISLTGSRRRVFQAIAASSIACLISFLIIRYRLSEYFHFLFFASVEVAALCLLQANKKICVIYGLKGMKDMDHGEEIIQDDDVKHDLFKTSIFIIFLSLLVSLTVAVVHYLAVN